MKTFGKHIPRKVSICLINGKIIEGRYKKSTKEIFGLEEMFRITSLSLFEIVLFTYYGGGLFHASIFNVECVEKPITNDNLVLGTNLSVELIEYLLCIFDNMVN